MKKKEDKFLLYVIGGFVIAFIGLALSLVVYNTINPSLSYNDMDQVNSFAETKTQAEDAYLVYYYSETCGGCIAIKDEVLAFADNNPNNVAVYFFDVRSIPITTEQSAELTNFTGTPHMEIVVDGEYIGESIISGTPILNLIEEINNGNNPYLN